MNAFQKKDVRFAESGRRERASGGDVQVIELAERDKESW